MGRKHVSREKYFCVVKCGEIPLLHLESCMTTDMAYDLCCREACVCARVWVGRAYGNEVRVFARVVRATAHEHCNYPLQLKVCSWP